ncbi:mandelate racemase/muconate lactonizing enzyme family protein [Numidum massiliense]|uniref:mandelate racemase/muconate lactonizing enzyme family protein n=1 Tax=Numidum massiliense TaxID=1522315 RepID=UPI0006D56411|nr:dipeptide epimerase [Numidum massiliense]
MHITAVSIFGIRLPLKIPFVVSYESYDVMPSLIVKVETNTGLYGYGEAVPDEHVTGETWEGTYEVIRHTLAPAVLGKNPFDIEKIHATMDSCIYSAPAAKAAIDIACYDLMGKAVGQPVYNLIGGQYRQRLAVAKVLSIQEPHEMAEEATAALASGYRVLKLKVGTDKVKDIARIKAVRQAVGTDVPLRVDANQGWENSADALYALARIKACDIAWIEQPVAADDLDALREVKQQTTVPVMVDEGVRGSRDMREVIAKRAADKVNIKLMKCGGIFRAVQLTHQAEMAGMTCQIGSMVESSIGSAAGLHVATAKKNIRSSELTGPLLFSRDVGNLTYELPYVQMREKPGLGVDVDKGVLDELTVMRATVGS